MRPRSSGVSVARQLGAARAQGQALLKVTGYGRGQSKVSAHLGYITRKGAVVLEDEKGALYHGRAAVLELSQEWAQGYSTRANSRDTAHIVLGVPPGNEREGLERAVRSYLSEAYPEHRYAWVRHDDTAAPHCHVVLSLTNQRTGRKLDLRKGVLDAERERFAAFCREEGIAVDATRAWERGRSPHPKERALEARLRRRGAHLDKSRAMVAHAQQDPSADTQPWVAKREALAAEQAEWYRQSAAAVETQAEGMSDSVAGSDLRAASQLLSDYADGMRAAPTRKQEATAALQERGLVASAEVEASPEHGVGGLNSGGADMEPEVGD